MAPTSDIRWGILGPGWIAQLFAEDLGRTPGARCVAVASRDLKRAKEFAGKFGVEQAYGSYEELVASRDVDIVYIATPHSHHHAHAKLALEAGKAVLVEKPFAMNAEQAEDIFALARKRGLFAMDAMWTLCNPLFRKLAAHVANGDIGRPRAFSSFIGPMGVPRNHRIEDPDLGGSFALECQVYPVNILSGLAPNLVKDAEVTAAAVLSPRNVDTSASIYLRNADGYAAMTGGFVFGTDGSGPSGIQLIGDDGWLSITDNLFNPGRALISAKGKSMTEATEPLSSERYRWEIEEAGRCLRDGRTESSIVTHELTLNSLRVLDQASIAVRGKVLS
jgi:predicted dehydrogenase